MVSSFSVFLRIISEMLLSPLLMSFCFSTFVPYPFQYSRMPPQEQDWAFRLEMWDDQDTHVQELIALVSDHAVARAVSRRPGNAIVLRQKLSKVLT